MRDATVLLIRRIRQEIGNVSNVDWSQSGAYGAGAQMGTLKGKIGDNLRTITPQRDKGHIESLTARLEESEHRLLSINDRMSAIVNATLGFSTDAGISPTEADGPAAGTIALLERQIMAVERAVGTLAVTLSRLDTL